MSSTSTCPFKIKLKSHVYCCRKEEKFPKKEAFSFALIQLFAHVLSITPKKG